MRSSASAETPTTGSRSTRAGHLDADFLAHFAANAILDRLAGLDESRERAEHGGRKAVRAREQDFGSARHENHHRGRHTRIGDKPAGRAFLRALARLVARRGAAASTETMGSVPVDDLERARDERQ